MKKCTRCGEVKDLSCFTLQRGKPRSHCRPCASEQSQESQRRRRERNEEEYKRHQRDKKRKQVYSRYGVSQTYINELGEAQNWQCYICGVDIERRSYVDHDHSTNLVRKLLCFHCNVGLGHFRDSSVLLDRASEYLREHDV